MLDLLLIARVILYRSTVTRYDRNGNITTLQRYGRTGASTYGRIDYLALTYSGNRLSTVKDTGSAAYGNDFRYSNTTSTTYSYTYDAAGRMTKDAAKGISSITWNVLGLPQTVTFSNGNVINYSYAADGTKLREARTASGTTTTTDYTGTLVLEDGTRSRMLFDGGYISMSDNAYHFFLTDHLGSVRVVANSNGVAEEYNHYYPLGGLLPTSTSSTGIQPLKYQGKEWAGAKGLNLYDFGARRYDPATGRWLSPDPLAEKYYGHSPYLFCAANPMMYVDPTGESTRVRRLDNGMYEVVGVDFDDDNSIFIARKNDKGEWVSTTESIGMTPSLYSFVYEDNTPALGAIINPSDYTGMDFIEDLTGNLRPLGYYMLKARNEHQYDFKMTNGGRTIQYENRKEYYRGMPILKSSDGIQFYGSARDVGNLVAGYYAAAYGLTWDEAREAFNSYNGRKEPAVSVYGQRFGYNWGSMLPVNERTTRRNVNFLIISALPAYKAIKNLGNAK